MNRVLAVLAMVTLGAPAFGQQQKHRVAVLDFGYGTVQNSVQAMFGSNQDIGKGISDLLIDRLLSDGTYRVIERNQLNKILAEQNFSNSDRADASTAAKLGRLLGVDAIIVGDITQFGRDDHNTNVGSALSRFDRYGLGKVGVRNAKAVVAVTARLVDVNTGEILASVKGKGESKRSGTNLLGEGGNWNTGAGGSLDMGSSNFSQTILGEAVSSAVTQIASGLDEKSGTLPTHEVTVKGLVADATNGTLIVNVGTKAGVHAGQKLAVTRVSRVIKDPATGKVLRTMEEPVGMMTVTSADEQSAVGTFTGSGTAKVGDTVKSE
jgi:curli biogenesis system outer membrane secretion channel CsgG